MNIPVIVLGLIRIVFGIAWVGIAFFYVLFFEATIRAADSAGEPAIAGVCPTRCPLSIGLGSILMTAAGLSIYLDNSGGFPANWVFTPAGIALAAGTTAGLLAFALGLVIQSPCAMQMRAFRKAVQAAGDALTSAQAHELNRLRERFWEASGWEAVLVIVSAIAIAIALELTWF